MTNIVQFHPTVWLMAALVLALIDQGHIQTAAICLGVFGLLGAFLIGNDE